MTNDQRGAAAGVAQVSELSSDEDGASDRAPQSAPLPSPAEQVPQQEVSGEIGKIEAMPEASARASCSEPARSGGPFPNGNTAGPSAVEEVKEAIARIPGLVPSLPRISLRHAEELDRLRAENTKLWGFISFTPY